jgi:hypothetical protein
MRGDRLHQKLAIVARATAALGDLYQLLFGLGHVVLQQIGLTEILPGFGVVGIDSKRLMVVRDAFIDIAELARRASSTRSPAAR